MKKTKTNRKTTKEPKVPKVKQLLADDLQQINGGGCICCLQHHVN